MQKNEILENNAFTHAKELNPFELFTSGFYNRAFNRAQHNFERFFFPILIL